MVALGAVSRVTVQFTPAAVTPPVLLKSTAAPGSKLVPVRVSGAPPVSGLEEIEREVIAGAEKAGGVCPASRKATNCMTQPPDAKVAVAL